LSQLELNEFKCLNPIVGQIKNENQTDYRYLCTKGLTEVHIIKFFKKNDFYVIEELPNALVYTGNYFLNQTYFESAFNPFEIRKCISDDIKWYLPKDLIQFLEQTKNSRFIECDKLLANYSKENVYHSDKNRRKFKHSTEEIKLTKIVKIDQNCGNSEITIFIHSSPKTSGQYFDKREATRKTWVSDAIKFNVKAFFVIADAEDDKTQKELESEALEHKDMIQFGFDNSYYNNTLKHISLLRWAQQKCLDTKYIMKTDDDIIVNVKQLIENLQSLKTGITGYLFTTMEPIRDVTNPWFLPECLYPDAVYPHYVSGNAYLITKDVIKPLIETIDQFSGPIIDIDDVFVTGILAEKAGVKRYENDKIIYTDQCQTGSNNICFMFNTIALFFCHSGNGMTEFWNKWKETNIDSCNFTNKLL
jgi:beta-1,3-galactosyltransferase 1